METVHGESVVKGVKSHHSLVTPIDWKPVDRVDCELFDISSHHSLVTPVDWKRAIGERVERFNPSHHSLVTPIDWKLPDGTQNEAVNRMVTTRW